MYIDIETHMVKNRLCVKSGIPYSLYLAHGALMFFKIALKCWVKLH